MYDTHGKAETQKGKAETQKAGFSPPVGFDWGQRQDEFNKNLVKRCERLEDQLDKLKKEHQDLIDNLRIFMVNDEEEEHAKK